VLRITIVETPSEQKWILQGRLVGPWAAELMSNWKKAHKETNGRECVVDLREVTFIDSIGEKVLTRMIRQNTHFIVGGIYATHVIENLQARCKHPSHKTVLLLLAWFLLFTVWPRRAASSTSFGTHMVAPVQQNARAKQMRPSLSGPAKDSRFVPVEQRGELWKLH
jgi:hypothetical protein